MKAWGIGRGRVGGVGWALAFGLGGGGGGATRAGREEDGGWGMAGAQEGGLPWYWA